MKHISEAMADLLEDILPPEGMAIYRANLKAQEAREAELADQIRNGCIDALAEISAALRYPRISADALARAMENISGALHAALELEQ